MGEKQADIHKLLTCLREKEDIYHIHKDTDTVCVFPCSLIVNAWQQLHFIKQKPEKQRNPCRESEQRQNSSCFQREVTEPLSESPHGLTLEPVAAFRARTLYILHMEGNTAKYTASRQRNAVCSCVHLEQWHLKWNHLHHGGMRDWYSFHPPVSMQKI